MYCKYFVRIGNVFAFWFVNASWIIGSIKGLMQHLIFEDFHHSLYFSSSLYLEGI